MIQSPDVKQSLTYFHLLVQGISIHVVLFSFNPHYLQEAWEAIKAIVCRAILGLIKYENKITMHIERVCNISFFFLSRISEQLLSQYTNIFIDIVQYSNRCKCSSE